MFCRYSVVLLVVVLGALIEAGKVAKKKELNSDTLLLYTKKSSLPRNIGDGVFARKDIPVGSIVCEYRGNIVAMNDPMTQLSDKVMGLNVAGVDYAILGDNICAIINDAANVLDNPRFDGMGEYLPYRGFDNNCEMVGNFGKLFYVSTRDIEKGEELFVSYGRCGLFLYTNSL